MSKLVTPDVRVKRSQPDRVQRAENKRKLESALYEDNEVKLRVTMEVYDPTAQRYSALKGESLVVRCRSKEAVAVVVSGVVDAVVVLDELRLGGQGR